jgi:hypothetical protein
MATAATGTRPETGRDTDTADTGLAGTDLRALSATVQQMHVSMIF